MPFSKLGLSPSLCTALPGLGYTTPTEVQVASIPIVLTGADVFTRAQTGTGKTAAFGLPMIDRLLVRQHRSQRRHPLGLVLVPTRELAVQVERSLAGYGRSVGLRVTAIFGGVAMTPQIRALKNGTDIVVATPGRLIDHLQRRTIDLSAVEILTLDEADRMLDMGFLPPLRRVLLTVPRSRQTLMFSATWSAGVVQLSSEFSRDAQRVDVSPAGGAAPTITHRIHPVDLDRKRALLVHVVTQAPAGQALVFCKTKRGADRVGEHLNEVGLNATVIHGNKAQGARNRSLADFKSGRASILVATDIAARGLDIVQLPLVVNYDLPLVADDYIHRVGRTGRAGLAGRAVSLVTPADRLLLRDIQQLLSEPLEQVPVAGFEVTSVATRTDQRGPSSHRAPGSAGRPTWRGARPRPSRDAGSRSRERR